VTVGRVQIEPGQHYPADALAHPGAYRHVGDRGRVLNEWQFVYLESGSGWFADASGVRRTVGAGDMLVIRPGIWHRYAPGKATGWTERWVGFTGVTFDQALSAVGLDAGPGVIECPEPHLVLTAHDELLALARINDASSHVSMVALILRMVGALGGSVARGPRASYSREIAASVQTMQTALDGSITVAALASAAGLSESAFRRRFAREIGMSPYHFYMTLRINQAKMELAHSGLPLRTVAEKLGFTDPFHLSRTFKEYTGLSPSQWRAGGG
jgi:AraC-like DNA-binding protein